MTQAEEPVPEETTISNSSQQIADQKMEEFNSELDIYSEIDSAYFKANSPGRRKGLLASPVKAVHMRPVAEDSEEDRRSDGS